MEAMFKFPDFHSPSLTDTDFEAKPMVLLMGQYSTGAEAVLCAGAVCRALCCVLCCVRPC